MKKNWIFKMIVLASALTPILAGCNSLQSIEVQRVPTKIIYGQGQKFDWSGLSVMAHYKKDSRTAQIDSLSISGYDKTRPGIQTVTVVMKTLFSRKESQPFTVTVVPVKKIAIVQLPTKTAFMQGIDNFEPTGLTAVCEFESGMVPVERLEAHVLSFSGYNRDQAGVQTITVDYYGKQAFFDVKVAALTMITIASPPNMTEYFIGEDIVLDGLAVNGIWEELGSNSVSLTKENISGYDKNRAGKQDVFVNYHGKTASFQVTYLAMQALSVSKPPAKVNYTLGEELDLDGLSVLGTRSGAVTIELVDISRLKISGYDKLKTGVQTISLALGGKTATFKVTVTPNSKVHPELVGRWKVDNIYYLIITADNKLGRSTVSFDSILSESNKSYIADIVDVTGNKLTLKFAGQNGHYILEYQLSGNTLIFLGKKSDFLEMLGYDYDNMRYIKQ